MNLKVSLVFDESDFNIGRNIFAGLSERRINVYCSHPELISNTYAWGKSYSEIMEFMYSEDVNYCIVLLSPFLIKKLDKGITYHFVCRSRH